ncbi:MAG: hypothetical protein JRD89_09350 [Deltaproteobacteria bacterium]|nr:hypothetical protein [Deltaproteobacteria bacterium]
MKKEKIVEKVVVRFKADWDEKDPIHELVFNTEEEALDWVQKAGVDAEIKRVPGVYRKQLYRNGFLTGTYGKVWVPLEEGKCPSPFFF